MTNRTVNLEALIQKYPQASKESISFAKSIRNGDITLKEGQTYLQAYQEQLNSTGFSFKTIGTAAKGFFKNLGGKLVSGLLNAGIGMAVSALVSLIGKGISLVYDQISGKAAEAKYS